MRLRFWLSVLVGVDERIRMNGGEGLRYSFLVLIVRRSLTLLTVRRLPIKR